MAKTSEHAYWLVFPLQEKGTEMKHYTHTGKYFIYNLPMTAEHAAELHRRALENAPEYTHLTLHKIERSGKTIARTQ